MPNLYASALEITKHLEAAAKMTPDQLATINLALRSQQERIKELEAQVDASSDSTLQESNAELQAANKDLAKRLDEMRSLKDSYSETIDQAMECVEQCLAVIPAHVKAEIFGSGRAFFFDAARKLSLWIREARQTAIDDTWRQARANEGNAITHYLRERDEAYAARNAAVNMQHELGQQVRGLHVQIEALKNRDTAKIERYLQGELEEAKKTAATLRAAHEQGMDSRQDLRDRLRQVTEDRDRLSVVVAQQREQMMKHEAMDRRAVNTLDDLYRHFFGQQREWQFEDRPGSKITQMVAELRGEKNQACKRLQDELEALTDIVRNYQAKG